MRWMLALLVACGVAVAQDAPEPDPFAPIGAPVQGWARGALPHAEARYEESLRLLAAHLKDEPADAEALERALTLCETIGRTTQLLPRARAALATPGLPDETAAALESLVGHLIVAKANETGGNVRVFVFGPGGGMQVQRDEDAIKLYREAVPHLTRAIEKRPLDARALWDLAEAWDGIDEEANAEKVARLRAEASAVEARRETFTLPIASRDWSDRVMELQRKATEREQADEDPEHVAALRLRYEALVLEFTNGTVPFPYTAALDEPVSLLASPDLVREHLTRSYRKQSGEIDFVQPLYHPPAATRRLEILDRLASDASAGSTAVLLAVMLRAVVTDPLGDAALDAIARRPRPELVEHLPSLLAAALAGDEDWLYPPAGQRRLVQLAGRLRLETAAPVLAAALAGPGDLYLPRGLAEALGAIGRPGDAGTLLRIARDPRADVYFRRRAVDGLAALGADLPEDLDRDPAVAVAVAAARLAREPSEALEGRLLAALGDELQADDAARYCAKLGLKTAIPQIEDRLAQAKESAISGPLAEALAILQGGS